MILAHLDDKKTLEDINLSVNLMLYREKTCYLTKKLFIS